MVSVVARRGTSNSNLRGNSTDRRRRREWLVSNFRAEVDAIVWIDGTLKAAPLGAGMPVCRCYRCECLLTVTSVSVDRIIPGALGGKYIRSNIRPACELCNSETGGLLGAEQKRLRATQKTGSVVDMTTNEGGGA
ncbi:MAG: HNH endonuclease [Candidatus Paceibacterota bacterium]